MVSPTHSVCPRGLFVHPEALTQLTTTAFVNMLEQIGGIAYLYLAHVAQSPAAPVVAFGTVISTLSKTVLYWAQEYYCGFCAIGHNGVPQLILWVILNGYVFLCLSLIDQG
jgi:hypothetical protein